MPHNPVEVERKWLVQDLPALAGEKGQEVMQGYIAVAADGTEVRLRKADGNFFLTVKSAGGLVREEIEIELAPHQFEALWRATAGRRLKKVRYTGQWQGYKMEIDVYRGSLAGLTVAEVEFPSASASEGFAPPPWCGPEVTEDARYKNVSLALHGKPAAR
jgi:CYTH domain-containing protein